MFGNYKRILDDKNRILIPSKLRKNLGNFVYITLGLDNILEIRNKSDFLNWKEKLLSNNLLNKQTRIFTRLLLGNTFDIELDKQGRIILPDIFKQKTKIKKEIVFVGVGSKIEIWSNEKYLEFLKKFNEENSLGILADKLFKDGVEI